MINFKLISKIDNTVTYSCWTNSSEETSVIEIRNNNIFDIILKNEKHLISWLRHAFNTIVKIKEQDSSYPKEGYAAWY